jgi:PelA/Pel-15E family pectate lyase
MTRRSVSGFIFLLCTASPAGPLPAQSPDAQLAKEARQALGRAARFYREQVASHGGYVYYYSVDLAERWGEGKATPDTIFVQPPGTPTVGMAYLAAYEATGDRYYLEAAQETAEALVYGQLQSGGWTQTVHFAPANRLGKYRNGRGGSWNVSSLDDGQTQAALQFLARADQALGFRHTAIHDAALYGFDALLKAQFPNGAFPQVWREPVPSQPVVAARYPDYEWRTEGRLKNYWDYYTLNDGLAGTVAETLITAHKVYGDDKYRVALEKLGDFLILAQMPDPQPAWCQQYNYDMVPIWARKFEPPAVTGWESQDVMETLITISRDTQQAKYLEPIPRALDYLRASRLPEGRVARYYEFRTNRPLYMDGNYQLTYDDSAAPSHYGWKQPARLDEIERALRAARNGEEPKAEQPVTDEAVRAILRDLDNEGRWISTYAGARLVGQPKFTPSFRHISSDVFSRNVETLSAYLSAGARRP